MKRISVIFVLTSIILAGCMYPQNELAKNQIPNEAQVNEVQEAIDQYREDNDGLVPIRTKDSDVPKYEKYIVDLIALKDEHYISQIPGTSYENGGQFQYVLVDPEETAQVKLIDLKLSDKLRELNREMQTYRSKGHYPPYGEQISKDIFQLDYKKMGLKEEPYVVSPFTQNNLPFVLHANGQIYIDYRMDIYEYYNEFKDEYNFEDDEDIRYILTEQSYFVPVYSLPYTWEDDEPQFNLELSE
ncbi:MAG TPA: hypothetical protein VK075_06700 [Pseudogracilibacillus sp.]|nr:hypothetical protein [Pseudogracilibacillus sp.]